MAERQTGCNRVIQAIQLANQRVADGHKINPELVFCAFEQYCNNTGVKNGTTPDTHCDLTDMPGGPIPPSNRTERFMGQLTSHLVIFDSQNGSTPQTQ